MPQAETTDTPATWYCLGCGYIIDHLPEKRCPECGREFDLSDPETYWIRPTNARRDVVRCGLKAALAFIAASGAIAAEILIETQLPELSFAALTALVAAAGIGMGFAFVSGVVANVLRPIPPWALREGGIRLIWARCLAILEAACWAIAAVCFTSVLFIFVVLISRIL